jgi:putative PIN family toxin of toxin-antitoxin system
MRVVVDTNVFVSAALKDTSLPAFATRMTGRTGVLLKSDATEAQLFAVLAHPYFVPLIASASHDWLKRLMASAEAVTITERITACRDPTDDKFLELAVCGKADFIITGDADLLVLNPFRGILVASPVNFLRNMPG